MKPRIRLIPFLLLLLLLLLLRFGESDLRSDREALVRLRQGLRMGGRTLLWNLSLESPCSWFGVTCDSAGVTELRLPGAGLSGELPLGLGNLTRLNTLSLRFNLLSGPVPSDLARLSSLVELHLEGNLFSGELPEYLFNMRNLARLILAGNSFSGEIPLGFNNLTNLDVLYLDRNRFTGPIPEINLPGLDQFNVSVNSLNGSIPDSLSRFSAASFAGNSLCGRPLTPCGGSGDGAGGGGGGGGGGGTGAERRKKGLSGGAIAGIVIGCVIAVLVILAILLILCLRNGDEEEEVMKDSGEKFPEAAEAPRPKAAAAAVERERASGEHPRATARRSGGGSGSGGSGNRNLVFFGSGVRVFDLEGLLRASAEVLGKGSFGTTYKASLEVGVTVAVKRLKDSIVGESEFRQRMEQIGKLDHENLVLLRAYYYSRDEKLLVYDFMPMGSLSSLLHGNNGTGRTPLNWETRSRIALGAARGVSYLHSHGPFPSHGNIKSSNILLTKSYEARVSDFGLAHLAAPNPTTIHRVAGYRAPEAAEPHKVSTKADVYSFGVLLLELLTGRSPTHSQLNDDGVDLPRWVQSVAGDELTSEVFDLELLRYQNVEEEMVDLLQIALECTSQNPNKRPSMADVAKRIEHLCRSSALHQDDDDDANNDSFYGTDEAISQHYYSADSFGQSSRKDSRD